jgi:thioredoxin-related protein
MPFTGHILQRRYYLKLMLLIAILLAPKAGAGSFFAHPVIDLYNAEERVLSGAGQLSVVLFFEPNCSWCFKQTKVFNQYIKQCNTPIHFIGIGVNAKRQALKTTAWKLKADFPLYMASSQLLSDMGKVDSTPLTLLLDSKGNILTHIKGYINQDKWRLLVGKNHTGSISCSS